MITVDKREMLEHPEIPEFLNIPLTVEQLDAGDYAFLDYYNEPLGIERSEINNLMEKVRSGELESQLDKCNLFYKTVMLITEGVCDHVSGYLSVYKPSRDGGAYFRNRIYPRTWYVELKGLQARLSYLGIEVLETANFDCTMRTIKTIYEQRTSPDEKSSLFRKLRPVRIPTKLSANPAVPKLLALCERMSERTAIKLINKYESIWGILNTPHNELLEIDGMGKTLLARLMEGVGKCQE